jgi:uncharacterized protein YndB with AHSA1/START domain
VHGTTESQAQLRSERGAHERSILDQAREGTQRGAVARRPVPTGHRARHDDQDWVVYTRRIDRPVRTVWEALAFPEARARWVGTSRPLDEERGEFLFTFEGDDLLPMTYRLDHVEPGRSAGVSLRDPGAERSWRLEVDLLADGDATLLRVEQTIVNAAIAPWVAAGCEFYLDRLVAFLEGRTLRGHDYDEYFLGQADHYRRLFPVQRRAVD